MLRLWLVGLLGVPSHFRVQLNLGFVICGRIGNLTIQPVTCIIINLSQYQVTSNFYSSYLFCFILDMKSLN